MFLSKMSFLDSVEHDPTKNVPCLLYLIDWMMKGTGYEIAQK
jgi:hypothetical protein